MSAAESNRSREELARLGTEVYDRCVRPRLRPEDDGMYVAVDIESGDYEINESDYEAVTRLKARRPAADVWLERAGYPAAYKFTRARCSEAG
jgi:hypothetical protein